MALKQVHLSSIHCCSTSRKQRETKVLSKKLCFFCFFFIFSNFSTEGTAAFELPPEQQQLLNQAAIGGPALPGQHQYPVTVEGAGGEAGLPEQPAPPMGGAVGGACDVQLVQNFIDNMDKTRDGDSLSKLMDAELLRDVETVQHLQIASCTCVATHFFTLFYSFCNLRDCVQGISVLQRSEGV